MRQAVLFLLSLCGIAHSQQGQQLLLSQKIAGNVTPSFQDAHSGSGAPPFALASFAVSANDTLVVTVGYQGAGCSAAWTVGGTGGDSFTQQASATTSFTCTKIFTLVASAHASGSYVVTSSTAGGEGLFNVSVLRFSGTLTAVDQTGSGTATSGTSITSSSMTVTGTPEVIVAGVENYYEDSTIAAGAGGYILPCPTPGTATCATHSAGSGNGQVSSIYQVANPASGAYTPNVSNTGGSGTFGGLAAVTIK